MQFDRILQTNFTLAAVAKLPISVVFGDHAVNCGCGLRQAVYPGNFAVKSIFV
jgi:hypothetical protein